VSNNVQASLVHFFFFFVVVRLLKSGLGEKGI
jgi:hypothetical protein